MRVLPQLRLDRILGNAGAASRSEAARLIRRGAVLVDGVPARSGADKHDPERVRITVNGEEIRYRRFHYFMMNKPAGYVSATEDSREQTVIALLAPRDAALGLFPAGRLDKDAEGLLILTNDGAFTHEVISPGKEVYKTYYVEAAGPLGEGDVSAFRDGICLKDGLECLPGTLEILRSGDESAAFVRIREGKYHQVKRMLAALGKPVRYLKRVAIGGLRLDEGLAPGAYRPLSEEERNSVFQDISGDGPP